MANFNIVARIPARHHLSTSVPQTEMVRGGFRQVTGRTASPSHGISIGYYSAWTPSEVAVGDARLRIFADPDFKPDRRAIEGAFRWTYGQLTRLFGNANCALSRRDDKIPGEVYGRNGGKLMRTLPISRAQHRQMPEHLGLAKLPSVCAGAEASQRVHIDLVTVQSDQRAAF